MNRATRQGLISATQIVQEFNVTYQAVNHYTNLGLLDVITKNGNARMYDRLKVKDRLAAIVELVNEGYSLRLIRKKLVGV